MKHLTSRARLGFRVDPIQRKSEPHAFHFLGERTTFWVAVISVMAFVTGNMVGKHGWYAFWASVRGAGDESLVVYTGTVPPVEYVPDYTRWYLYGGGAPDHTFRQVPEDLLVPLPAYDAAVQSRSYGDSPAGDIYSIGNAGSYEHGGEGTGSHPGVDIRMPVGTDVRSMANGIVTETKDDPGGFGKVIVVKHPNVPDPSDPARFTTLYSNYAHLSAFLVSVGSVVQKGEVIGLSGNTGFATGPHLHFQIDREDALYHPFWPFTRAEARAGGLTFEEAVDRGLGSEKIARYTVHPMLYVQANYPAPLTIADRVDERRSRRETARPSVAGTEIAMRLRDRVPSVDVRSFAVDRPATVVSDAPPLSPLEIFSHARSRREERIRARLALRAASPRAQVSGEAPAIGPAPEVALAVIGREEVAIAGDAAPPAALEEATQADFRVPATFSGRQWETVFVALLDGDGNIVRNPVLHGDIVLRAAYGEAEFRPSVLSVLDFENGVAQVNMLPRGRRTIVIRAFPFTQLSKPIQYEG